MRRISVEPLQALPVARRRVELVERKGVGHPDTISDAIAEEISLALCHTYTELFGGILHHNIDKGLLVAGVTEPKLGGGRVIEPMRLVIGDRAVLHYQGVDIPIDRIVREAVEEWVTHHLRFVDPERHIIIQNELKPGSPELVDIFNREQVVANDTSAAVGYAPFTPLEQLVYRTERFINGSAFKEDFPEIGEDVKVMGVRQGDSVTLTIAAAFVDRFIDREATYFRRKEEALARIQAFVDEEFGAHFQGIRVDMNTLDVPGRGEAGMYLTVLGTSAEGGDCGQVGRGNRVNGVIALNRPMGTEAAAGKNPVSHVGKIYNILSHYMANEIYERVEGLEEVYVWLCSQIGRPIDDPLIASAQVVLAEGASLADVEKAIRDIMVQELAQIYSFTERLAHGEFRVW
ncbi:MAG: methionine adenosyltransferase [Chloroflexi bacterium]|nr:methionine adenosyltransferase [Chloroflexota bacterium]